MKPPPPGIDIDRLYEQFCAARDSFINTTLKRPLPRMFLHNPLWHLYHGEETKKQTDAALADYAVKWWKSVGLEITLNREDGSFTINTPS